MRSGASKRTNLCIRQCLCSFARYRFLGTHPSAEMPAASGIADDSRCVFYWLVGDIDPALRVRTCESTN